MTILLFLSLLKTNELSHWRGFGAHQNSVYGRHKKSLPVLRNLTGFCSALAGW